MDWANAAVVGLFVLTFLASIYQVQREGWRSSQILGSTVFLVGLAIALFLDDVLPVDSLLLPWAEPIGAMLLLIGLAISRIWKPERTSPDNPG